MEVLILPILSLVHIIFSVMCCLETSECVQAAAMKAVSNAYESCSVPGILEIPGGFKSKVTVLTLKLCWAYAAYKPSCWTLTSLNISCCSASELLQ